MRKTFPTLAAMLTLLLTVAAAAQATSYTVFAIFVVTVLSAVPQLAVILGAAVGALVSYTGQALFAFRPRRSA